MFRKLVSNLPFSPALVGQIGFYAARLRKEEATRRLGLFMTVLAIIVQSITMAMPSTSANSSNDSDLIRGGVSSLTQVLSTYDDPSKDYKKIMDYAGITRDEIANAKKTTINSRDYGVSDGAWLSWGRVPRWSASQGEVRHDIDGTTVYSRPLWRVDSTSWTTVHGSMYPALVGNSAKIGKFAIALGCGNLITRKIPPVVRKVTICRPDVGIISINENEKLASDLPSVDDACKPKMPAATCVNILEPIRIDRTHYNFKAQANAENGASISGYIFTVRKDNKSGAVVTTKTVNSAATTAESGAIELRTTGAYYVDVIVKTSLGDKASDDCAATVTVTPAEVCEVNQDILKSNPDCKPCAGNQALWLKDAACNEVTVESKTATNLTQGKDARKVIANPGDRISYTITVTNPGKVPATANFADLVDDILEYSTIQDNGGGVYNPDKKTLSWSSVQLAAGTKQTRTFVVALPAKIPSSAQGSSDPTSYDCVMNNTFGDNTQIKVNCDTPKVLEQTIKQLPSTGPGSNMLFAGTLLFVVTFLWARSRQLGTEVRLVRKDFSASTI